jgi:transposase
MAKKTKISTVKKAKKKPKVSARKPVPAKPAGGRPTKYKPEYSEQVFKLCLLGLIDREIAKYFEVSESTFNKWKLEYPEFSESLKRGKVQADANVAASLYRQAMDGNVTAQIFILKNRHKDRWREKQTQVLENPDGTPIISKDYKVTLKI